MRSQSAGGIRGDGATWSNIAHTNANTDVYATMASVHKESSPHLMRLVQMEFPDETTITKREGDGARQAAFANYGHAGRAFAAYIAPRQEQLRETIYKYIAEADAAVDGQSQERFWIAWIACCRLAAEILYDLGLVNFTVDEDVQWMYKLVDTLRASTKVHTESGREVLADFFDTHQMNILTISAKSSGNVDNVSTEPRTELLIRKELDLGRAYISRSALQDYCIEKNINLSRMLSTLRRERVVTHDSRSKNLGLGTRWEGGLVRCIEVDLTELGLEEDPTP